MLPEQSWEWVVEQSCVGTRDTSCLEMENRRCPPCRVRLWGGESSPRSNLHGEAAGERSNQQRDHQDWPVKLEMLTGHASLKTSPPPPGRFLQQKWVLVCWCSLYGRCEDSESCCLPNIENTADQQMCKSQNEKRVEARQPGSSKRPKYLNYQTYRY